MIIFELVVQVRLYICMFKRIQREERERERERERPDKLTLYYYNDYSTLMFVNVDNAAMMIGRIVRSVCVCMYRSKL